MILLNNQFYERENVNIDIEDRGYQFGDGIYEVVRVYNGKPFRMDEHSIRFERSARELKLRLPMTTKEINGQILQLIKENQLVDGYVYYQLTRGVAPRNHAFPSKESPVLVGYTKELQRPLADMTNGVKVVTVEDIRWLRCDIKSLNLLGNVLAKEYAVENGAKEAIQIRGNTITEGSASNFFIVKDGKLLTHPANNLILKGITRNVVEELAKKLDILFVEQEFTLEEAYQADEAFISGTTVEVTPVIQIDEKIIGKEPGPITKRLQESFEALI